MKTACTGLPLAGWKDTILLPQQKKSYGATVDFRRFTDNCTKIINAKKISNDMFWNGTNIYSIQKVSDKKKAKFFACRWNTQPQPSFSLTSPSKFLQKTHKSQTASVGHYSFFFFPFKPGRAIWEPINMASSWGTNAKIFECHIPCMRFREILKTNLKAGNSRSF